MIGDVTPGYEPYSIVIDKDEAPFFDAYLTSVDYSVEAIGWHVLFGSTGMFVPKLPVHRAGVVLRDVIIPKVGDHIRVYITNMTDVHGIQINDDVIFYRTQTQRDAYRRRELEDISSLQGRQYALSKDIYDLQYASLPEIFRQRIDWLRAQDEKKFNEEQINYELFCLTEAVKIATHCKRLDVNDPLGEWERMITESGSRAITPAWPALEALGVISQRHNTATIGHALDFARVLLQREAGEKRWPWIPATTTS